MMVIVLMVQILCVVLLVVSIISAVRNHKAKEKISPLWSFSGVVIALVFMGWIGFSYKIRMIYNEVVPIYQIQGQSGTPIQFIEQEGHLVTLRELNLQEEFKSSKYIRIWKSYPSLGIEWEDARYTNDIPDFMTELACYQP